MIQPFGVKSEGIYRAAKPVRDPAYLRFIRSQPCAVCASMRGVEAAHTGPRGLSQKANDRGAIPLCRTHHQVGKYSYHGLGARKFGELYGLNLAGLVGELNQIYDSQKERVG